VLSGLPLLARTFLSVVRLRKQLCQSREEGTAIAKSNQGRAAPIFKRERSLTAAPAFREIVEQAAADLSNFRAEQRQECAKAPSNGALAWLRNLHQSNVTKFLRNRMSLADTYRGGLLITIVILICGYSTPRLLRWVAKSLARIAD